jgi:hypothetical protein
MHFWRKDYFQTLKEVAAEAATRSQWSEYGAFCQEYERGLRREAFTILNRLISSLERASFSDRRDFLSWLLPKADSKEGKPMLITHPLHIRIVEQTILEWTIVDHENSEPQEDERI